MALGKNLKRKKLISKETGKEEPKKVKKKALIKKESSSTKNKKSTKKAVSTQGAQSSKPKKQKPNPKTVKKERKKKEVEKQETAYHFDPVLSNYIANELRERKTKLRKQYAGEIAEIKDKNIQLVSFIINDEIYAVDIHIIKEIVKFPQLSKTPNTPKHIKGLANVRGTSYVVFDLAARFATEGIHDPDYLMIFNHDQIKASLVLENLPSTTKVAGKNISSEIEMIENATLDLSYIKGIIHLDEKLAYYLDVVEMLKNDKAVVIPDDLKK